jgi:hypothetical protein
VPPAGAVFMIVGFGQLGLAALGYAGVLVATWTPRLSPYRKRLVGAVVGSVPGAMVGLAAGYALAIVLGTAAQFLASVRNSDSLILILMSIVAAGYLVGLAVGCWADLWRVRRRGRCWRWGARRQRRRPLRQRARCHPEPALQTRIELRNVRRGRPTNSSDEAGER